MSVISPIENRGAERAGVLNVFLPGGFEAMMPTIIGYFADQRAGDTRSSA